MTAGTRGTARRLAAALAALLATAGLGGLLGLPLLTAAGDADLSWHDLAASGHGYEVGLAYASAAGLALGAACAVGLSFARPAARPSVHAALRLGLAAGGLACLAALAGLVGFVVAWTLGPGAGSIRFGLGAWSACAAAGAAVVFAGLTPPRIDVRHPLSQVALVASVALVLGPIVPTGWVGGYYHDDLTLALAPAGPWGDAADLAAASRLAWVAVLAACAAGLFVHGPDRPVASRLIWWATCGLLAGTGAVAAQLAFHYSSIPGAAFRDPTDLVAAALALAAHATPLLRRRASTPTPDAGGGSDHTPFPRSSPGDP